MKIENTSIRLKKIMFERGLKQVDILELAKPYCVQLGTRLNKNDLSQYVSGKVEPGSHKLTILGLALNVSEAWLMGYDVPIARQTIENNASNFPHPSVTNDFTTFPVIGEIAAGYDNIAIENWEGDMVDIPNSYLGGRPREEFFVLKVKGGSMWPDYRDGDKVLILKQSTMDYSGQVGAVIYDDNIGTLKKIEYKNGENWIKLVPINPVVEVIEITGESLEHCRILGIPKLLIRNIQD